MMVALFAFAVLCLVFVGGTGGWIGFIAASYAILMEEQLVQYSEQTDIHEETGTAPVVPAPMVERTFRLLDLLSVTEEGLTLSDLARALTVSKGSLHGLLKTLESNGVIEQAERRFVLGPRIYELAQ